MVDLAAVVPKLPQRMRRAARVAPAWYAKGETAFAAQGEQVTGIRLVRYHLMDKPFKSHTNKPG